MAKIKSTGLIDPSSHRTKESSWMDGPSLPGVGSGGWGGYFADIFRIKIDYILELHVHGRIEASVCLPITPSMISIKRPASTLVTHTFGTTPVREHAYNRHLEIEIRGVSGHAHRQGNTADGKTEFMDGYHIVQEFDAFLDKYQSKAVEENGKAWLGTEQFRNRRNACYLVFRALNEKLHVLVEPTMWEVTRDAKKTRVGCDWMLSLQAYKAFGAKEPMGLLGPLEDYVNYATRMIDAGNNMIAFANNFMASTNQAIDVLRGPGRALTRMSQQIRYVMESAGSIHANARGLLMDYAVAVQGFSAAVNEARDLGDAGPMAGEGSALSDAWDRISWDGERSAILARDAMGAIGAGPILLDAAVESYEDVTSTWKSGENTTLYSFVPAEKGYGPVANPFIMGIAMDLFLIAQAIYGNSSEWETIAHFNDMPDAYTKSDGTLLMPGDVIYLPDVPHASQPMVAGPSGNPTDVFGEDLLLEDGDLVIKAGKLDVKTVRGPALLEQALRNRLSTPQGTSKSFPGYGVPVVPGDTIQPSMLGYLGSHFRGQVLRDLRFKDVVDVSIADEGDTLSVFVEAIPHMAKPVYTVVPFNSE